MHAISRHQTSPNRAMRGNDEKKTMGKDYKMQITLNSANTVGQHPKSTSDVQTRIERIARLTNWLDTAIQVPGTSFKLGWDTIIGVVPGVGDLFSTALSGWIINEARLLGASKFTLARMLANTAVDAVIGTVPLAGDLFDAAFKSNVKNLALLQRSLNKQGHHE